MPAPLRRAAPPTTASTYWSAIAVRLKVMADIVVVAKMADVVTYVINSRKTSKWSINRNLEKLAEQNIPKRKLSVKRCD